MFEVKIEDGDVKEGSVFFDISEEELKIALDFASKRGKSPDKKVRIAMVFNNKVGRIRAMSAGTWLRMFPL